RLLRAGLSVAICDQVEEADPGRRGLVRREVVRVLTPGTVVEEAYLEPGRGNYAVALAARPHHNGVAVLDCSTGELAVIRTDPGDDPLRDELARLRPAEVIAPETDRERLTPPPGGEATTWVAATDFDARGRSQRLRSLRVGDATGRARLRESLRPIADLERLVTRAGQGVASPRDLRAIARTIAALGPVAAATRAWPVLRWTSPPGLEAIRSELDRALVPDPPATLREGGVIRDGYDAERDSIQAGSRAAREWISNLETVERDRSGIRSLKVGFNQVFGYYLEVTHANRLPVPAEYVRKQTLVNGERYITPELKDKESVVLNAKSALVAREHAVFRQLCQQVTSAAPGLLQAAEAVGELDALASLADVAQREGWVRPALRLEPGIDIVGGRHPLVERALGPGRFVPNDLRLDPRDAQIVLLSGPNMAGKSTYLRQAALIVLLAQVGSFVPAARASIGLCDRIFTRVGAHDALARGLPPFLVAMVAT